MHGKPEESTPPALGDTTDRSLPKRHQNKHHVVMPAQRAARACVPCAQRARHAPHAACVGVGHAQAARRARHAAMGRQYGGGMVVGGREVVDRRRGGVGAHASQPYSVSTCCCHCLLFLSSHPKSCPCPVLKNELKQEDGMLENPINGMHARVKKYNVKRKTSGRNACFRSSNVVPPGKIESKTLSHTQVKGDVGKATTTSVSTSHVT